MITTQQQTKIQFVILCFLLFFYAASQDIDIVYNGMSISTIQSPKKLLIPFGKEFIGSSSIIDSEKIYKLQNYVNGIKDGSSIAFTEQGIIYNINYKNNNLNGPLVLYPDGIFSIFATVKNGILDGPCKMIFQPYKYSFKSKMKTISNYEKLNIKTPVSEWITSKGQNFKIETNGIYKDGKRFSGQFIQMNFKLDLRIIRIIQYDNYRIIKTSEEQVFKLKPYMKNRILGNYSSGEY